MRKLLLVISLLMIGLTAGAVNEKKAAEVSSTKSEKIIDLSGQWGFQLDPERAGEKEKWFETNLPYKIKLPGSTAENGYGEDISVDTKWTGDIIDHSWYTDKKYEKYRQPGNVKIPFWLTPLKHYVGWAWYQKTIDIPESWRNKKIFLFLERAHWETQLWVDGKKIGMQNSLSTPHEYDLGTLTPGKHHVTICVDNSVKIGVGVNAHSICDHTQTNWNGIVGDIQLRAVDPVWIEDLQVYPDVQNKVTKVRVTVTGPAGAKTKATLRLQAETSHAGRPHKPAFKEVKLDFDGHTAIEVIYPMGDDAVLWDEFSPNVYRMTATIKGRDFADSKSVDFGMREISTEGTQFTINGKKTFLRGTLECCIFPLTGYPAMDVGEWLRIIKVAKAHGLNHFRFHSWCPPKAAFIAADQLGFMFQVECACWANQGSTIGDGKSVDAFVYAEGDRILKAYGNHPSFCLLAYGNEPAGDNRNKFLADLLNYWKPKDPRHLYTSAAAWPILPENQYHCTPKPRIHQWGAGLSCRLNSRAPETVTDYRDFASKYNVPVISHEIGQWCVYPNFDEIKKYRGVTRAYNFEIFHDSLKENHMLDQAHDFLTASGKLQTLCYKEEIESALRTPGFGGFQLLDLHDFPGQGTALVGVLDPFWDEKGYVTAQEYHRFACETVPLVRMEKRVWTSDETFTAEVEISHFGAAPIKHAEPTWTITNNKGSEIASGKLPTKTIPLGNCIELGKIELPLAGITTATKMVLTVSLEGTSYSNDWDFWVHPKNIETATPQDILITEDLNEQALDVLKAGKKVMLMPAENSIRGDEFGKIPAGFTSIFWNTAWTRRQAPHTLGILCNPKHPALADFPTEYHSNWQWWDLVTKSQAVILNDFPRQFRPVVQIIDDWFTNRRLGLVFEANVNGGKLLLCSIDLESDLENRPVARQMRHSLLKYMDSDAFNPEHTLDAKLIKDLLAPASPDANRGSGLDSKAERDVTLEKDVQTKKDKNKTYSLDASNVSRKILTGHLKMGGKNPAGQQLYANNLYFTIDGKPVLPVMGEMHFSRYPRQYWEESILKMKANGIGVIATYIFWIYHEEFEGQFDWTGNNDLRHFVKLCAKHGLYVYPRIGPWAHGECRNGGFPDWLYGKCKPRSNDPAYLVYVRRLYKEIYKQLDGLLYKDGGPVIGVQLENEFRQRGGTDGQNHMMVLKNIAREVGIDVPLYTATGWGASPIPEDEIIPVFGGYSTAPWTGHIKPLPPSVNFLFTRIRDDPEAGLALSEKKDSDIFTDNNYDATRYPFTTAELGGGIMNTYHRRPIIAPKDAAKIALTKLGSGANLLGYYMFHGGSHRAGKSGPLQEDSTLKYPKISYDFQAPIREFGQINDSYYELKKLHLFLQDFASLVAPTLTALPDKQPSGSDDTETLRYAARVKDDSGFLFVNNYQVRANMRDFDNIRMQLKLKNELLKFPQKPFTVKSGTSFIWPFNLTMDRAVLKYATAQLLCKTEVQGQSTFFFFAIDGIEPEYAFDSSTVRNVNVSDGQVILNDKQVYVNKLKPGTDCVIALETTDGKKINIVTLTQTQSRNCWKGRIWGRERIFLTNSNLLFDREQLRIYGTDPAQMSFSVFPQPDKKLFDGSIELPRTNDGLFTRYTVQRSKKDVQVTLKSDGWRFGFPEWSVGISENALAGLNDLFLRIHYSADTAEAYIKKGWFKGQTRVASDNFYNGLPWEIGLKRSALALASPDPRWGRGPEISGKQLVIQLTPLYENAQIYLEKWPEFKDGKAAEIHKIEAIPEYEVVVTCK